MEVKQKNRSGESDQGLLSATQPKLTSTKTTNSPLLPAIRLNRSDLARTLVMFSILLVLLAIGIWQLFPPSVVPATTSSTQFSAERAFVHIKATAQTPHPVGSSAIEKSREYIIQQIQALGLTPQLQKSTGGTAYSNRLLAGTVQNIVARLDGQTPGKAIALVGHYDSQPQTPGAADDGAAVATLLETMRALKAGPPLQNDVIFIFTDGEEMDTLGAEAFAARHPWYKEIALLLNFDAGGNAGPSIVMRTTTPNGKLIQATGQAVADPLAFSFMPELLKLVPAGTDYDAFTGGTLAKMDMMYFYNRAVYHTSLDNIANFNLESLQHHGNYALALTRYFGDRDLDGLQGENVVYFSLLRTFVVSYPVSWALPLAILAGLLLGGLLVTGLRNGRLKPKGILGGALFFIASLLAPPILGSLVWLGVMVIQPDYWRFVIGTPYNSMVYLVAFLALTLGLVTTFFVLFHCKISTPDLLSGVLAVGVALTLLTGLYLPGFSYLFVWPVVFSLAPLAWLLLKKEAPFAENSWGMVGFSGLAVAPIMLLGIPLIFGLFMALGLLFPFVPSIPTIGPTLLFTAVLLGMMVPQLALLTKIRKWTLPLVAALISVLFLVVGSLTAGFDQSRPLPNGTWYVLDGDKAQASWYSYGDSPDSWSAQFFTAGYSNVSLEELYGSSTSMYPAKAIKGPAPLVNLSEPQLQVLSDRQESQGRTLEFKVSSPRHARTLHLQVSGPVQAVSLNGRAFEDSDWAKLEDWDLLYVGLPEEGLSIQLTTKLSQELTLKVTDTSDGLPEIAGLKWTGRPASMMPISTAQELMPYTDTTSVSKTFRLGAK
ncbi:MAG TPA: M20/M25/M40 family metallo-hydrolase [Chloroflexia bacterium]|nr:M20/M25/M40 family metallo-hydrolase [Chloroflexia bacterium]